MLQGRIEPWPPRQQALTKALCYSVGYVIANYNYLCIQSVEQQHGAEILTVIEAPYPGSHAPAAAKRRPNRQSASTRGRQPSGGSNFWPFLFFFQIFYFFLKFQYLAYKFGWLYHV